jgi:aquaporin Z
VPLHKKLFSEAFGTFWLVLAGTGAIVVNDLTGALTHFGVASVFGLVVFVMISALGDISGAHFNPAVTIGFYLAKRLPGKTVVPYIASQIVGAVLASVVVHYLFPSHTTLGITSPAGSYAQTWALEAILTMGLMFVILGVSTGASEKGITAALAIGGIVALEALFGGPISGASMNPARSLAPALVSGHMQALWLYLTAPVFGSAAAVVACICIRDKECCSCAGAESCT